jgi:hypothetical protein
MSLENPTTIKEKEKEKEKLEAQKKTKSIKVKNVFKNLKIKIPTKLLNKK